MPQGRARGHLGALLARLRESAVQLARGDAREIVSRFGRLGERRLAVAS